MSNRPNILYIHSHDTGRYIQPYGHAVPTPNLQRLAEEGVLFRNNHTINPTCSPSRACLLTGQYAHQNGMLGLAHRGFSLNDYSRHLLHTLRDKAGYHSALAGVQHIAHGKDCGTEVIGYDEVIAGSDEDAVPAVSAWLEDAPSDPWFLAVGFGHTHRAFARLSPAEDPRYTLPPAPLPDRPETREDMARFKASARLLDEQMGVVFETLRSTGLLENTLVICTTDHGIAFPRMKCNLHDSGTGVMLILRGPGFTGGGVVDTMTTHMDIFPTVCDLLQIDAPEWLEGRSLLPLAKGETDDLHEAIFTEVNYHAAYEPMRAVRTKQWKYIRRFDGRTRAVLPNCDDGPSKSVWVDAGTWAPVVDEQLYDLLVDPNETANCAHAPGYFDVLEEMRAKMHAWMKRTNDPLIQGPVPAPKGARITDPDCDSPGGPLLKAESD